jgi:ATP-dependent Clp protease ATP-binding subunit ClpC
MDTVKPTIDYDSPRARKARLAHYIASKEVYWWLLFAGLLVLAGGVAIVWFWEVSLGWLLAGLGSPFLMVAAYGKSLRDIAPKPNATTIDGLLDANVLGLLKPNHTPADLVEVVRHTPGGQFFGGRFGIGLLLMQSASKHAEDSVRVWEEAERIRLQMGLPDISAALLTTALLNSLPSAGTVLAPYKLSQEDLLAGVEWYERLQKTIAKHHIHRHDGGVGRDWSFGYASLLQHFGQNLSDYVTYNGLLSPELPSRQRVLSQVMQLLSQGGRHNVALVGPLGVGKTTVVHKLAQKLLEPRPDVPAELRYRQIIALDPSSLIAQARERGELEELVNRLCFEAFKAKNVILFLDDAELFFEDGHGAVDLSRILLPVLDAGALKIILAMDEQRWLQIAQSNPGLSQHLNRVMLQPTDKTETMSAMQDQVPFFEFQNKVTYTYQALDAAYRLSSRYLSEQAMPGKAVKLLESAGTLADDHFVTEHSIAESIEQTQGVKVGTADSESERQTLLNLEQLIHERMINQTRAVQVVSDALRRARAGVRSTNRPIGTFLFLGPTGVGKTELAKSVAAVFFGGEDHLVRLDLNEYVRSEDVSRLLADAAHDQHSLTAQISRQPFSVVLLDEIEKAHPNVLGTLLQMLDEGILRDINNREVSFRDAVVIATSNAGAERIRDHIQKGEQLEQFEEQFTNELISANIFRPEFLNRFDEIVLFRPLNRPELMQVIDLILKGVNRNLAPQRVSVVVDDEAKSLLVEAGYDPRLGARPMRRVVQRVVENIVANQMLAQQVQPGGQVRVTAQDVHAMLQRNGK